MAQGQTLSWIARKLKVNRSAISRTKDIMLNEPWNLIEEYDNSYGKTYTLTPAGYKILMAHDVTTQKKPEKDGLEEKTKGP
jgi:DNA-binding MarR family transcriptional regulator